MSTEKSAPESDRKMIFRFRWPERIEHIILLISFIGLASTGLPQKFAQNHLAESMIALLGGIETVRIIHRVFAVVLMTLVSWHFLYVVFTERGHRQLMDMLPRRRDARPHGLQSRRLPKAPLSQG